MIGLEFVLGFASAYAVSAVFGLMWAVAVRDEDLPTLDERGELRVDRTF
jgi:hypothetical protein